MANRAGSELYDFRHHPIAWAMHTNAGRFTVATAAVAALALSTVLPATLPRNRSVQVPNIPGISRSSDSTNSQSSTGVSASDIYLSQVESALLQDVPDLVNPAYKSTLDYTSQRVVDFRNVYGLSLDQVRAPIAKWVQANIYWDKKGERLINLTDSPNFMPLNLADENETYDPQTQKHNQEIATPQRIKSATDPTAKIPYAEMLSANVDSIIAGHDKIWGELHDNSKLTEYLDVAGDAPLVFTEQEAAKYRSVIRQYGAFSDKAHLALIGRAWKYGISNEEITRNEVAEAMALAVGGDVRIETNNQLWDITNYTGTAKIISNSSDRQPSFRKSPDFKRYLDENKSVYGPQLDPDYIAPSLPSLQAIENAKGWIAPETGVKLIKIESVTTQLGNGNIEYLFPERGRIEYFFPNSNLKK